MKVICINDKPLLGKIIDDDWQLEFGETYNVVGTKIRSGELYYVLDISIPYGYLHIHFAIISSLDETLLVNEKQLQSCVG